MGAEPGSAFYRPGDLEACWAYLRVGQDWVKGTAPLRAAGSISLFCFVSPNENSALS